jgi:hypothetical protein
MCRICDDIDNTPVGPAMAKIEAAIQGGVPPEHFKAAIDRLLGTEDPAQDDDLDKAWERSHRGGR